MIKLEQEIKFLKAFKKRFTTNQMYRAAIDDMWKEGIITPKAYDYIINDFIPSKKNTFIESELVPKEVMKVLKKGIPSSAKKAVEIDPCSRGGGYRSSC